MVTPMSEGVKDKQVNKGASKNVHRYNKNVICTCIWCNIRFYLHIDRL